LIQRSAPERENPEPHSHRALPRARETRARSNAINALNILKEKQPGWIKVELKP
jgi:hypothetical protein